MLVLFLPLFDVKLFIRKVQRYSIQEIFDKRLLFLIPFYIFTHEGKFSEYDKDERKLEALMDEYEYIKNLRNARLSICQIRYWNI